METAYLDHASSTPLLPEVVESMAPYGTGLVGNPSSVHRWGRLARSALRRSRVRVAELLGVAPPEVVFVRGGTESTNLAVLGRAAWALQNRSERPSFLHSAIEHPAVRGPMDALERAGARVGVLPVSPRGELTFPDPAWLLDPGLALVSVQWVNHETGLILPIDAVAARCKESGVPLHVDAIQAVGRVPVDPCVPDLLSISGHKLGGPRGSGVLVVREGTDLIPLLFGGGQEGGLRPGTEDVAAAVGFTTALEWVLQRMEVESARLTALRTTLESAFRKDLPDLRVHCAEGPRAPHILSVGLPGLPRDLLPTALDLEGVGASAGSACLSGSTGVSPVLLALYGKQVRETAPLRFSLGWTTTAGEVARCATALRSVVERIPGVGVTR